MTYGGEGFHEQCYVIPGLEYFALAGDILGSQISGYSLKHVYVELFMGLYHRQLGLCKLSFDRTIFPM